MSNAEVILWFSLDFDIPCSIFTSPLNPAQQTQLSAFPPMSPIARSLHQARLTARSAPKSPLGTALSTDNAGLTIFNGPDLIFPGRALFSSSLLIASWNAHCHHATAFGLPVLGNSFPKCNLAFLLLPAWWALSLQSCAGTEVSVQVGTALE